MEPTLKQLRYLAAVADELNFRRAAGRCFISQPALSEQIRLLEEIMGGQLVERGKRQIVMTPLGELVAERAKDILTRVDDLMEAASQGARPFAVPVTLGVIPTIAPYLLPRILAPIRKGLPELTLLLREEKTSGLLDRLRNRQIDLALLALPVEGSDLAVAPLYMEDFILVTPAGHPLGGRGDLREKDIAGEPVLLLEEGHCFRGQALEICRSAGAEENHQFYASSLNTLVQMVAYGIGITLLPRLALEVECRGNPALAHGTFAGPAPSRKVGLAWRRSSPRRDEFEAIRDLVAKRLPKNVNPLT